ncbi:hypothetical protein K435DRAFT_587416, partial [Dendrothele bispora CBS 962.96]
RVDIWDNPESPTVIATFELPGVRREDLAVHVQDHRKDNGHEPQQQGRFSRAELRYGKFSRKLDLGRGVFEYHVIAADLREGMLTVTWPRVPPGSESEKAT